MLAVNYMGGDPGLDEDKVPVVPPEFAAFLATIFELSCSTLLAPDLATRVATLPLLGMIAVIQTCVYPNAWGAGRADRGDVTPTY